MTAPVWRYLDNGAVKHALSPVSHPQAVCGLEAWLSEWCGDLNDGERARLAALRPCAHCLRRGGVTR